MHLAKLTFFPRIVRPHALELKCWDFYSLEQGTSLDLLRDLHFMRWLDVPTPAFLTTQPNHFVKCHQCQTGEITCGESVQQHLAGRDHHNKLLYLAEVQKKMKAIGSRSEHVGVAKDLEARIESLGLTRWQWEVQALLLEGDQNDKPGVATEAPLSEVIVNEYMRNLTQA